MSDAKVQITVEMPHRLVREFLQHIRNFDVAHFSDTKFKIWAEVPEFSLEQTEQMFDSIKPPFPERMVTRGGAS